MPRSASPDPAPIVVVIDRDPSTSSRAVEAARIALGLAASEHPVAVVLMGQAVRLVTDDPDTLLDGDDVARILPGLRSLHVPVHVDAGPVEPWDTEGPTVAPLTSAEIADLVTAARRVLVF